MADKIAVLIPCYNEEKTVEKQDGSKGYPRYEKSTSGGCDLRI